MTANIHSLSQKCSRCKKITNLKTDNGIPLPSQICGHCGFGLS